MNEQLKHNPTFLNLSPFGKLVYLCLDLDRDYSTNGITQKSSKTIQSECNLDSETFEQGWAELLSSGLIAYDESTHTLVSLIHWERKRINNPSHAVKLIRLIDSMLKLGENEAIRAYQAMTEGEILNKYEASFIDDVRAGEPVITQQKSKTIPLKNNKRCRLKRSEISHIKTVCPVIDLDYGLNCYVKWIHECPDDRLSINREVAISRLNEFLPTLLSPQVQTTERTRQRTTEPIQRKHSSKRTNVSMERPADVSDGVWSDYVQARTNRKAIISDSVIQGLRKEAESAEMTLEAVLMKMTEKGWISFDHRWLKTTHYPSWNIVILLNTAIVIAQTMVEVQQRSRVNEF